MRAYDLLPLLAMLAIACGKEPPQGRIRAVVAVEGGEDVVLAIDDEPLARGPASAVIGAFFPVSAGDHVVSVSADGRRFDEHIRIVDGIDYTVIQPSDPSAAPTVVTDEPAEASEDPAGLALRFVHGSSSGYASLVDIYLGAPEERLAGATPSTFDFSNGKVTPFTATTPGSYRLRVTGATQPGDVLYDSGPFQLEGSGKLSFVMLDVPGTPGALTFLVLTEDGSWGLPPFDPCARDAADNDASSARTFQGSVMLDGLCSAGDVDFYVFELTEAQLAVVELSTEGLASSLTPTLTVMDAQGRTLDQPSQREGTATSRVFLFGGQRYFVRVADEEGAGGADYLYELRLALRYAAPSVAAAGGSFSAASNRATITPFEGAFVALSAASEAGEALGYKSMVRVTGLTDSVHEFVFDPALAQDGLLRVLLSDGSATLPSAPRVSLAATGLVPLTGQLAGWFAATELARPTPLAAVRGTMSVAFPHETLSWTANGDALAVPTVRDALLSATRDRLRVTFAAPPRATAYEVSAFGRVSGAAGKVESNRSPVSVMFSSPLGEQEPYALRVTAGDVGLIRFPLTQRALNVSEYLFYSDAE